jgi:hypothetical protein
MKTHYKSIIFVFCTALLFSACKSTKNQTKNNSNAEQISEEPKPPLPQPLPPVVYTGTAQKGQQPSDVAERLKALPDSLFASIQRTPCYGMCATYTAMVYKSGYATYSGTRAVEKLGNFSAKISKADMEKITFEAEKINYFGMNDEYDNYATDLPSTYLFVSKTGQRKMVKARQNVPEELKGFGKFFDELLDRQEWKKEADSGSQH